MTANRCLTCVVVAGLTVAGGLWLAMPSTKAAFTDHFDALEMELALRVVTLGSSTNKVELKQAKACVKALATIAKSTTSLATDIKAAGKVAKTLQKAFPNEFTPVVAKGTVTPQGAFTNLEDLLIDVFIELGEDIQEEIDELAAAVAGLPPGSTKDKAQAALDQAQLLLDEATASGDFATAAKLGAKALKAALKGQSIAGDGGGGGSTNNTFSATIIIGGTNYNFSTSFAEARWEQGATFLDIGGGDGGFIVSVLVCTNFTGNPGDFALDNSCGGGVVDLMTFNLWGIQEGTMHVATFNPGTPSTSGTFAYTAFDGLTTITVTNGMFDLHNVMIEP